MTIWKQKILKNIWNLQKNKNNALWKVKNEDVRGTSSIKEQSSPKRRIYSHILGIKQIFSVNCCKHINVPNYHSHGITWICILMIRLSFQTVVFCLLKSLNSCEEQVMLTEESEKFMWADLAPLTLALWHVALGILVTGTLKHFWQRRCEAAA